MRHFCTYFDQNYLTRGLVLYDSLARHSRHPFVLWILCFDPETFHELTKLALPHARLIRLEQFEANDDELRAVKPQRSKVEYYWTCTPSLPLYILRLQPEIEMITYLDADICFYLDPEPLFDELGQGNIALIEHRYAERHAHLTARAGIYNVGWLTFRNNAAGLACLQWWRARCHEWCYARFEAGKFGDQLYLDEVPARFDGVVVLQHTGADVAPWNMERYHIHTDRGRWWIDEQPLIFCHFHGLQAVTRILFMPTAQRYWICPRVVQGLYIPYLNQLHRQARRLGQPMHAPGQLDAQAMLHGLLERRYALRAPGWLARVVWTHAQNSAEHIAQGTLAYRGGQVALMRRHYLAALAWNPTYLFSALFGSLFSATPYVKRARARKKGGRQSNKVSA